MIRFRWLGVLVVLAVATASAQQPSIDDFFRELSDGWVRLNPNLAVSTRYFSATSRTASSGKSRRIPTLRNSSALHTSSGDASSSARFDRRA